MVPLKANSKIRPGYFVILQNITINLSRVIPPKGSKVSHRCNNELQPRHVAEQTDSVPIQRLSPRPKYRSRSFVFLASPSLNLYSTGPDSQSNIFIPRPIDEHARIGMGSPVEFEAFDLDPRLLQGIKDLGFDELFPIQAEAIAPILQGRDLIGQAHT